MPQIYKSIDLECNNFGGGDILIDLWSKHRISDLITLHLGERSPRAENSYADGLLTLLISQCRQCKRIEHLKYSKKSLERHPRFEKAVSPDVFLYMSKELALPKAQIRFDTDIITNERRSKKSRYANHEIVIINRFNNLLVDAAIKLGLLNCETNYILDFDTSHIPTKIKDARRYYDGDGKRAYCPAAATIDNIPVYIENRNGNTNASFNLVNSIQAALDLLSKKGIKIGLIRMDAAGFTKEFAQFANLNNIKFIVRAKNPTVQKHIENIKNWRNARVGENIDEIADSTFFFGNEETRLVVKRMSKPTIDDDGKETKDWGLITNDFESLNEEIINTYALRAGSEHFFSYLKEGGWDILPMRKIEFNTVYLYFTAFNFLVLRFMKRIINSKLKNVKEVMELGTFIREFMSIVTFWDGDELVFTKDSIDYKNLADST